jgi:hypothetical protein
LFGQLGDYILQILMKRSYLISALCCASLAPLPALADVFTFTGSVQQFTAPTTGFYDIVAFGASGGNGNTSGGLGAEMGGDFTLMAGEILDIYVGGVGQTFYRDPGGGGGGTFVVVDSTTSPLVIAGGGGGGGNATNGQPGLTTVVNMGQGGPAGANTGGGGGGGFISPSNGGGPTLVPYEGGGGFPGLAGGMGFFFGLQLSGNGGYGGGGGGGQGAGGGGGGYGGGAGGNYFLGAGGQGGGSFLGHDVVDALAVSGENSGNGSVSITPVITPEPGSLSLFSLGLLALAGLRKFGRRH